MLILTIRTDKPESEIGLFNKDQKLAYETWEAHRQLAETIHKKIDDLLHIQHLSLKVVEGVVVYRGPGSFTGLRIGVSVANALAYSLQVPIVGADGVEWIKDGMKLLLAGENHRTVLPEYGGNVFITKPKK